MTLKDYSLNNESEPPVDFERQLELPDLEHFESIEALDLERQLLTQYAHIQRLRDWCVLDLDTPTNQKAQVMNTCTNLLMQLTKMQTDLWNVERLKKMEACLIRCLNKLPEHAVKGFLAEYEQSLKELSRAT